jgi:C1A family cysteine protease
MRQRTIRTFSLGLLAGGLTLAAAGSVSPPRALLAPLNPDYVRYLVDRQSGRIPAYSPGLLVPSPQDISHLGGMVPLEADALPAVYDLRVLNKMTPVRNEGASGGSLAFAALASLESYLKPLETWDFSELHLLSSLQGAGYLEAVVGAMARWADPVREGDDPWPAADSAAISAVKHVQNVTFIPPRTGPQDNNSLKQAIMDGGAVYAEMTYVGTFYDAANAAYYNAATADGEKRAVALAGWDDNFDRGKFNPQPPGNGAFICKNSLGPAWGNAGYFYVSYYDGFLARRYFSATFEAEPLSGYTVNYQYDLNGCTARLGFGTETAWFANIFTATASDPLTAVAFYTYAPSSAYDITIYKNPTPGQPQSGTGMLRVTGTLIDPRYATVPLKASIPLLPNDRFSVVVKLQTTGDLFPIPIEHPVAGSTTVFSANAGEGFISADGAEWNDLTTYEGAAYAKTSICLKAFAGYGPIYPPASLKVERLTNNFFFFKEYVDKLSWDANPNNAAAPVKYRIYQKTLDTAGADFRSIGETSADFRFFFVRAVKKSNSFLYRVRAIMADGRESDPAEISI